MSEIPRPWLTGRPISDPAKKRSKAVMVMMTQGEYEALLTLAEDQVTRPSTLLHKLLVKYIQQAKS